MSIPLRWAVGDRCRTPLGKIGRVTWIGPSGKHAIVVFPGEKLGHLLKLADLDLAIDPLADTEPPGAP